MKKKAKKLALKRETLANLNQVHGGFLSIINCPTTDPCAVSKAFTNCYHCPTRTALKTTCFGCAGGGNPTILIQH